MECKKCLNHLPEGSKFCNKCGEKVKVLSIEERLSKLEDQFLTVKYEIGKIVTGKPSREGMSAIGVSLIKKKIERRTRKQTDEDVKTIIEYMINNDERNITKASNVLGLAVPNSRRKEIYKKTAKALRSKATKAKSPNDKRIIKGKQLGEIIKRLAAEGVPQKELFKKAHARLKAEDAGHLPGMLRAHALTPPKDPVKAAVADLHKYDKRQMPSSINGINDTNKVRAIISMLHNLSAGAQPSIKPGDLELIGVDNYDDAITGILRETPAICSYLGIIDKFKVRYIDGIMAIVYGG